ncbi:MAG: OmpA family protein [Arenimonas sp.]
MKKKLLCCALLGAMSMAQSAMAQDFDDRWYISGTIGILGTDTDRADALTGSASNAALYGFGVGKMVSSNVSVDVDLNRATSTLDNLPDIDWQLTSLAVTGRYHFIKEGRNWWPYLAAGIGAEKNKFKFPGGSSGGGSNMLVKLGAGLQADVSDHVDIRIEGGMRLDFNDDFNEGHYQDLYATASVLFALGNLPAPVTPDAPEAPAADCSTKDDDGDGVNNCNDRCPNSQAGQAIGPDGCPVPLTIDLKGVNFDFDKDTLRPDAVVILDEAADILNKYPQLRVEVAGHTDSVGTEVYNQDLSQRRAQVVYNYLTGKGVDAARLAGPNGFGELKPIDVNTTKEGRARNRRTELNVQN